jgi:VWFA-related protein
VDKDDRFVATLQKEDIRLTEDEVPQEISFFERRTDGRTSVAILIDTSASEEQVLPGEKVAAQAFVDAILHSGKDQAAIVGFTGESTVEQALTQDLARVHSAIDRLKFVAPPGCIGGGVVIGIPPGSGTPNALAGSTGIWDVISSTVEGLFTATSINSRRAIILLTDGEDTSGKLKMRDAIEHAIRADVAIYAIGIADKRNFDLNKDALRKVTERTGGRAFFPTKLVDVQAAFGAIEQEIRSQYLVGYTPVSKKLGNSFRKVRLEVINPVLRKAGVRVIHPEGYYAK